MPDKIDFSIIIPNLHSPMIDQTIESVLAQKTDRPFEIIVVGMDKWDLVEKYPQVKFIKTEHPVGAAEARNTGIKVAQGEWLIFIDSDCIADENWIENLVHAFNQGWLVVGGGVKTPLKPFFILVYNLSMFHAQLSTQERKTVKFLPTLNLAVKREVVEKVGTLDEMLLRGQDVDWTARMSLAGYDLLFEPQAAILHIPARTDLPTLRDYFHKSGYYMIQVRHRYPQIFKTTAIFKQVWFYRWFAPVIAAMTTFKIMLHSKEVRMHYKTIPYIFLLKLSWCYGAAASLNERKEGRNDR